eukprot:CAMPEP_0202970042 /NCGR_PEP_ID=MMETSP1396-20130829/16001_1 /ASSEMBLY_ACC=CAM_ASM_000872 /TAXON_ID= /ORGANISM="Pseudokeronopsis sp., Strain Brazil" /LENGTH=57 /DNA_ID=CAMNT_0049698267 /DNA_START=46 /DNA_END=215 /DNA_ORIENTATION=-
MIVITGWISIGEGEKVDIEKITKNTIRSLGYDKLEYGLDYNLASIIYEVEFVHPEEL